MRKWCQKYNQVTARTRAYAKHTSKSSFYAQPQNNIWGDLLYDYCRFKIRALVVAITQWPSHCLPLSGLDFDHEQVIHF